MAKKKEIKIDLVITMKWYNLNSKELDKIAKWIDKVPKKPRYHSEE